MFWCCRCDPLRGEEVLELFSECCQRALCSVYVRNHWTSSQGISIGFYVGSKEMNLEADSQLHPKLRLIPAHLPQAWLSVYI